MVRNNMLVKTVEMGSPRRRTAERPGGLSAGGSAALESAEDDYHFWHVCAKNVAPARRAGRAEGGFSA